MDKAIECKQTGEEPTAVVPYGWADEIEPGACNERVWLFDWTRGGMALLQDYDDPAPGLPRFCVEKKNEDAPAEPDDG